MISKFGGWVLEISKMQRPLLVPGWHEPTEGGQQQRLDAVSRSLGNLQSPDTKSPLEAHTSGSVLKTLIHPHCGLVLNKM